jgi:Tfp pilus assembly protein PilV
VRALRGDGDMNNCDGCPFADLEIAFVFCDETKIVTNAADRLESQEREIASLKERIRCDEIRAEAEQWPDWKKEAYNSLATSAHAKKLELSGDKDTIISALTARAEQAERERDAAVEHVHDAIFGTNHSCFYCTMENCDGCTNRTVKEHFKYRGLLPRKYLVKNEG